MPCLQLKSKSWRQRESAKSGKKFGRPQTVFWKTVFHGFLGVTSHDWTEGLKRARLTEVQKRLQCLRPRVQCLFHSFLSSTIYHRFAIDQLGSTWGLLKQECFFLPTSRYCRTPPRRMAWPCSIVLCRPSPVWRWCTTSSKGQTWQLGSRLWVHEEMLWSLFAKCRRACSHGGFAAYGTGRVKKKTVICRGAIVSSCPLL